MFFAVLIIIIVSLPILTLEGVEGKMFRPMALTVVFALIGSLVLALTLMPVLASLGFKATASEHEPRLIHWLKARYRPWLHRTVARPLFTGAIAAGVFVASLGLVPFMGAEFIPKLDEGAVALQAWRLPSDRILEEHDAHRTHAEAVPRGRNGRITHRPGRDSYRPDGRRDQ